MDLTPTNYVCWAQVIEKYSGQLADKIAAEEKGYKYVLDIGSGLGNISSLLYRKLTIENLIGVDVDQRMVDYANMHRSNTKIKFMKEDMSEDWDKLSPELRAMEGKFDLIFSSFVFHFISDRLTAAKNILRLLAPGGQLQAIALCLTDPFQDLTNGNSVKIDIPSAQKQMELWSRAFDQAGLRVDQANLFTFEEPLPKEVAETYYQAVCVCYEMFLVNGTEMGTGKKIAKLAKEKLVEASPKFIGDVKGTKFLRCESHMYVLKVSKA